MFIATNRFRVTPGCEFDFEELWRMRDTRFGSVPGFLGFHLLRGPETEDHTLFSSQVVWASHTAFEDWIRSEAFRVSHLDTGNHRGLHLGKPRFEGFDVVLSL